MEIYKVAWNVVLLYLANLSDTNTKLILLQCHIYVCIKSGSILIHPYVCYLEKEIEDTWRQTFQNDLIDS